MLHEFNAAVSGLFDSDLAELKIVVQSVNALNGTTVNPDGTYKLPIGFDKSWFETSKNEFDYMMQTLQHLLILEDTALQNLNLTKEQRDWYKKAKKLLKANPAKLFADLYKNDTLWAVISKISTRYPSVADNFLTGMTLLEKMGSSQAGQFLKTASKKLGAVTTPVKYILNEKLGLPKFLANTTFFQGIGAGNVVNIVGKAGTVHTFASIAATGITAGITDGIKYNSIEKGIIGGTIEMIKSIGPLEGMTIALTASAAAGFTVVGLPALAGLGVGLLIQRAFDKNPNIKEGAFEVYDNVMENLSNIGEGVVQAFDGVKYFIGDLIRKTGVYAGTQTTRLGG